LIPPHPISLRSILVFTSHLIKIIGNKCPELREKRGIFNVNTSGSERMNMDVGYFVAYFMMLTVFQIIQCGIIV
jgi:hypothetical protein